MKGTGLPREVMPSPNVDDRGAGVEPSILLLHYTGMLSAEVALKRLCDPVAKVSSHYLVCGDGRIVQMVDEDKRAWHAGVSSWHGQTNINALSIGIEIHNVGHNGDYPDFGEAQMLAVIALAADIVTRHGMRPEHVLGHSDVAPGRKADPGEKFDWQRLWRAGVGHAVTPEPIGADVGLSLGQQSGDVQALQRALLAYGFGLEAHGTYDDKTRIVVEAFQRHFRPARVDGVADHSTRATLARLLSTLPQPSVHDTV